MAKKKTIKENVEAILALHEVARSSDKMLQLIYWRAVDKIDFKKFEFEYMEKATPSESITRARRIIQEEGRFLPTEEVADMRRSRETGMRESILNSREVI